MLDGGVTQHGVHRNHLDVVVYDKEIGILFDDERVLTRQRSRVYDESKQKPLPTMGVTVPMRSASC